jgi:5-formyltetrahydrofolate cyclo-ligase
MPSQVADAKSALRKLIRSRIASLPVQARHREDRIIASLIRLLPGYARAETVLLYISAFPEEIPTLELMAEAIADGKRVIFPRVNASERRLSLHEIREPRHDLAPGTLGIPEPRVGLEEFDPLGIDWALVPGLAFDLGRHRLGRGAGYYDRLLPNLGSDVPRWAVAYMAQRVDCVPIETHDQRLTGIAWGDGQITTE